VQEQSKEIFFVAENLAFRRSAWHSGAANFDNTAHLVTDGIIGPLSDTVDSAWISQTGADEWVFIDLGAPVPVSHVTVYWGESYALRYRIEGSSDGESWETLAVAAGAAMAPVETALSGITARHIRVFCENSSGSCFVIREVVVEGTPSGTPPAAWIPENLPPPEPDGTQKLQGGNWKLQRASEVAEGGAALSQGGYDDSRWLPATVPGTILVSYLKAGAIPDPNYDDWQFQISEAFFTADFWHRNHFVIPAAQQGKRVFLNFDSINWKADVFFNGRLLPNPLGERKKSIEGAFIRGKFDVTPLARFGEPNYLAVYVYKNDTPGAVTTQGLAEGPLPNGGALGADNPTIHAAVGWDWLPTIRGRDTGIIEDVYISYSGGVELLDPWMETRLGIAEKTNALSVRDLAREEAPRTSSGQDYAPVELACLTDGNKATQWIARDMDGADFTLDFGKPVTAGSVTIVWGTEEGGRAADLESRHPARFKLESSADGIIWNNFDAYPGGEVDGRWFGALQADPNPGTGEFEGHAISDSIQGGTALPVVDLSMFGQGKVPFPFFEPQEIRYLRFTSLRRRVVNGAPAPTRIREFRVYAESPLQVEQSMVRAYALDASRAELCFRTGIKNSRDTAASARITGRILPGNIPFEQSLRLEAGEELTAEIGGILLDKPELWWPNTYGSQFLYTARVAVTVDGEQSDEKEFRFGVRQFSYPVDGDMLTLYCNGTRIVAKGGNWGMDDGLKTDTPEVYDHKVRLHAEENFTMIRNWVGMTNHRAFYEACDKYGILIWDDFWLANPVDGPNPNDNAMFLHNAADKIKRNRGHAALAVYCGRNESSPPEALDRGLRELTAAHDGTRFYFPNSAGPPVGSGGGYSLAAPGGAYGIKQYFNDITSPVLRSERGIPNVPVLESMKKFIKPENLWPISEAWALHDWTYHMNGPANTYMSTLQRYIDGAFTVPVDTVRDQNPRAEDPVFQAYKAGVLKMVEDAGKAYALEDFQRMAQLVNYEHHRGLFEALATRRSNGLLMWMSQSSWPSLMWQTYDWYLDTNGGYFGAKAGCQPTRAVWDPRDNGIVLANASPRLYRDVTTTVTIFDLQGKPVFSRDYATGTLEPDAYGIPVAQADFSGSSTDLVFIRLTLRDSAGKVLGDNCYWHNRAAYQDYRGLNSLPEVELEAAASPQPGAASGNVRYAVRVNNPGTAPAVQTRVRALTETGEAILPVFYSDNYFALMPGESTIITVEFSPKEGTGLPRFSFDGWNTVGRVIKAES
jgi:beta-galactosidase/beta-glucuronidase